MIRFLLLSLLISVNTAAQHLMVFEGKAQGTYYIVKYFSADTASLQHPIDSIFGAIDQSLSLYKPGSLINRFNAGHQVQMDTHMQAVIAQSLWISKITAGAFDITVKPLVDVWGFGVHRPAVQTVPSADTLKQILQHVGYRYLRVKGQQLMKLKAGVEIDCDGIAQGYTSDVLAHFLEQKGIINYLVDVGGELCSKGFNQQHKIWTVGIERRDPVQTIIQLQDKAITTSGNYRRFFDQGGTRFAHTIDPVSGQALHSNIISVTVLAANAITADGFDNALILMGVEKSMEFIRQHPQYELEAYFIYKDTDGTIKEKFSPGFEKLLVK
jgi:thiamine biosynthesis lipoprotein